MVNMLPSIRDNVFSSNPALKYFTKKAMKKRGGASLSHGILYGTNDTAQAYQGYDLLNTNAQDGMTRDQWEWRQYAVSVSVDGFNERVANAGDAKLEDILDAKKMQAEEGLSLLIEQEIFAASPGTKSLRSLQTIIAASGTEGGINGTTNAWWQSRVTTSGSFSAQGRTDMTTAWNALSTRNPAGGPSIIISSQTEQEYYESSIVPQERFSSQAQADLGIQNLLFKTTPWIWSPQAPTGTIFLLHDKAIEFIVNSDTDFIMTPFVKPGDQDAKVAQILLAAALITGNRRKLGKLSSVTA
jgi:hypothetical protein